MKAINLYVLTREVNPGIRAEYEFALSGRDTATKFRPEEIKLIDVIVNNFIFHKAPEHVYDNWFYAFSIPQIGKEFDLLRIGEKEVINIEIKSREVESEKVEKQLYQNRYYLSHLNREIRSFTVMKKNDGTIHVLKYNNGLESSSFSELISAIDREKVILKRNIEKYFDPCLFLVSPLNTPDRFLNKEYFLNNQQLEIKKAILNLKPGEQLFGIKGAAGTGKTLLLYDIAYTLGETRKTCIIHGGNLSDGHKYLQAKSNTVSLLAAKKVTQKTIEEFEVICADETQRYYDKVIDIVLSQAAQKNTICVFSYDFNQALAKSEIKSNNPKRLRETSGFKEYELTGRVRTNKEINSFIRTMLRLSDLPKERISYDNIDIVYANSIKEADRIVHIYTRKEYKFITITPSQFKDNIIDHYSRNTNSHHVIGQEFDNVVVIIDSNFRYSEEGILQGKEHPNPNYLFARLFYQNITRARKRLCVIVLDNLDVFERLIKIKNHSILEIIRE